MAVYEFVCHKCGKKFEMKMKINTELKIDKCPVCDQQLDSHDFEKLISKSSFVLKFDTNY